MGVKTERPPTPRPETHRPIATWYHLYSVVICTMTPTQKTMLQTTIQARRPNLSAIGAAIRAPMRVPMLRSETIVPDLTLVNFSPLLAKRARKSARDISKCQSWKARWYAPGICSTSARLSSRWRDMAALTSRNPLICPVS